LGERGGGMNCQSAVPLFIRTSIIASIIKANRISGHQEGGIRVPGYQVK